MIVERKYFDVVIENNTFYMHESSFKPQSNNSAIAILEKIECVVKNKFKYCVERQDQYSNLSEVDLLKILKQKSLEIYNGYQEKQSQLPWIEKKIFSKIQQINECCVRIDNCISPPQIWPLLNELVQTIAKHLNVLDLTKLAQLNRCGKEHAATIIISRAKECGYEGSDYSQALRYLREIFFEVSHLFIQKIIPRKYNPEFSLEICLFQDAYYPIKNYKFDPENFLLNFKKVDIKDVLTILLSPGLYLDDPFHSRIGSGHSYKFVRGHQFINFYSFLIKYMKEYLSNNSNKLIDLNAINEGGNTLLMLATTKNKKEMVQLLLEHGADPNIVSELYFQSSPLHYAAYFKYTAIAELLLQYGADINCRSAKGSTPLMIAVRKDKKEVVQLLLQYGADINCRNAEGITALMIAVRDDKKEMVQLLMKYGAVHC